MQKVEDGLPPAARRLAVLVVALGTILAVLDGSIANVALPTIGRELRIHPASTIWVVNAFQLVVVMTLLPFASLGDKIGYRRVYAFGVGLFTIGSLCCALSREFGPLVASRALQGVGAAAIMSVGPALYRTIFPQRLLGQALGISALVVASSSAAGPTVGGAILAFLPWPWLFAVNVPFGILDAYGALRLLPREPGSGKPFDVTSALLSGPALALVVIALDGFAHRAPSLETAALLAAAIVLGTLFVLRQRRLEHPMLHIDLFRLPRFSLAASTSLCSFAAQGTAYVALPFLYQTVFGYTALEAGLLLTPWPLSIAAIAPFAGRLADRFSPPLLATSGLALFAAGLASMALLPAHPHPLDIVWRSVLCGIGFGFFQAPNNRELLGSAPREQSGSASGVLATARVTGQSLGAAFVAIVLGAGLGAAAVTTMHGGSEFAGPLRNALWIAAACAGLAALVSALRLRTPRILSAAGATMPENRSSKWTGRL